MNIPISKHLSEVKFRILRAVIITAIFSLFLVSFINGFNSRPLINILMPLFASVVLYFILKLTENHRLRYIIKIGVMIFLTNVYLAAAWLTSPGSYSAMSFYAVLLIFIGILLAEKPLEYAIPLIGLLEMIFFLNFEPTKPLQYGIYASAESRAIDLSINFTLVIVVLMYIVITLNNYFEDEHQRLFKMSITDQLTGVYNRRYLFSRLEEVHYLASKDKKSFSLLMIDINHFKLVNDTFGHSVGDEILIELGSILKNCCRKDDLPTRFGGDEFILILPDTKMAEALLVSQRIREAFSPLSTQYESIGLSLGIGVTESSGESIDDIIQQVDDHLYKDKRRSKENGIADGKL